ncbi:nuclease domain-containing protein [Undibacterium sp. Rencai35W]|uniref:nuclease domain-containing protein n=1 Tax=Undibacterium sp. Rencai35W TaxID=3413046 RepID=UPI003BF262ED
MRSNRPKMTPIRKAARGQECCLRFPFCNYDIQTTVLCHSNLLEDGKGAGLKAPDTAAAFGCSACHDMLDGRCKRPDDFSYELMIALFKDAVVHTHRILRRMGILEGLVHGSC